MIKNAKWFLIRELFKALERQKIIGILKNDTRLNYKPDHQEGIVNRLDETVRILFSSIKNEVPHFEYYKWLNDVEKLKDNNLIEMMDEESRKEYLILIEKHKKELENLIYNNKLSNNILEFGTF